MPANIRSRLARVKGRRGQSAPRHAAGCVVLSLADGIVGPVLAAARPVPFTCGSGGPAAPIPPEPTMTPDPWPVILYLRSELLRDPTLAALSAPLREATLFRRLLARLPIGLAEHESLAGDYGLCFADPALRDEVEAWRKTPPAAAPAVEGPWSQLARQYVCRASFSPAHTTADYEQVLKLGLSGLIRNLNAQAALQAPAGAEYLRAMVEALRGVAAWAARFAALEPGPGPDACHRVPDHPATTFHEAVQAVWLLHTAIGISELSDASLSLGRLDQYLYPYYRADRGRGISEEALETTLADLFRKLNRYGDAACAVNLGGVDAEGRDQVNDLTRMIIRVATWQQQPSPILAARVHPGLAQADFDALTAPELARIGQPTFYGENACRAALRQRGVADADLHRWAANSCMGLMMPGEEFSDMWGIVFTVLLPLELALNGGQPWRGGLPFKLQTRAPAAYTRTDDILDVTLRYTDELLGLLVAEHRRITEERGLSLPNPYLSALLHDCAERGCDRLLGGVRYHTVNVDAFALVNVADALTALATVVFQTRRWPLADVLAAVQNDFAGAEEVREALLAAPKYGNGDAEADATVNRLAQGFAAIVRRHSDARLVYMPSFHTLNAHIGAGSAYGASPDGRRAGEPFAKNVGPMPGQNRDGLTALLRSAASVGQTTFYGGQALDISVSADLLARPADRRKFQAALQAYFALGGLQVQVNGLAAETLRDAVARPQEHEDLIVRIAGYSARFVHLNGAVQQEMIARLENGL